MDELVDEAPCGFFAFSDKGIITRVNGTAADLLGYAKDELIGQKVEMLFNIAGKIFYQTHFFPLITLHNKAEEIFLSLLKKNGDQVPVLANAKRRLLHGVLENHCIIIPVYQRKKYEEELLQARRTAEDALNKNVHLLQLTRELESSKLELDNQVAKLSALNNDLVQFSNVISHDMQEPIRKIAVLADILRHDQQQQLSEQSNLIISKIDKAVNRLRNLIVSLQQYVSVDASNVPVTDCDLDNVLEKAIIKINSEFNADKIKLSTTRLPKVEGHADHLELLFYHLLKNASQHKRHDADAEVSITSDIIQQNSFRATKDKYNYVDFVRISIADSGKGFSNEYNSYVFELFKKAHVEAPGLGFGLALCKKIVDNHSGYIHAYSEVNKGTTITVLLPLKLSMAM